MQGKRFKSNEGGSLRKYLVEQPGGFALFPTSFAPAAAP
jgi:hypothetical protein